MNKNKRCKKVAMNFEGTMEMKMANFKGERLLCGAKTNTRLTLYDRLKHCF